MNLNLETEGSTLYRSNSQIARVLTEAWVAANAFCPRCGNDVLEKFPNNRPVADFVCPNCTSTFELKSKNGRIRDVLTDGAYRTMIERITSNSNPDFFFLSYNRMRSVITDFMIVPKYFFTPEIIEPRKPLAKSAVRAGWIGCNIRLGSIPEDGRIYIVNDGVLTSKYDVVAKFQKTAFLEQATLEMRGWLLQIMRLINRLNQANFTLQEMYSFEAELSASHPENNHVRAKIRQQLQVLRDKGYIEFSGRGNYRRL